MTRDSATVASGSPIDDTVDAIEYTDDALGRLASTQEPGGNISATSWRTRGPTTEEATRTRAGVR